MEHLLQAVATLFNAASAGFAIAAATKWWHSTKIEVPKTFPSYASNVEGVGYGWNPNLEKFSEALRLQSALSAAAARFTAAAALAAALATAAQALALLLPRHVL